MKRFLKKLVPVQLKKMVQEYRMKKVEKEYGGNEVTCLICNSSFKEFGPFGLRERKNARCHNCGSLERHRLLWKYLNDKRITGKPLSILHFAPERVFYDKFAVSKNVKYFPCDLVPEIYSYAGPVKVIKADITQIPFDSNSFDFILCNHVLEHIPDDSLAMSELYRVMKNGGVGIFQVPIDYDREKTYEDFSITTPEGRLKAFGQHDHVRWYGRDYKDRLASAGFDVTEDDYVSTFSKEDQYRYGFLNEEKIYFCKK